MSRLTDEQEAIARFDKGMIVVDAGPGTGKTKTIVSRYVNLMSGGVSPEKMMMVTFTRNAAKEMEERIKKEITERVTQSQLPESMRRKTEEVRCSTFDALCLRIVQENPSTVSGFFGLDSTLSRNARLVENGTLNSEFFRRFYSEFILKHGSRYRNADTDVAVICSGAADDIYNLLNRLMAKGMVPLRYEWFRNDEAALIGDIGKLTEIIDSKEDASTDALSDIVKKANEFRLPDDMDESALSSAKKTGFRELLEEAAGEDRTMLFEFVRDVYFGFIEHSVANNRLTFGLTALFAFTILYNDRAVRESSGFEYMMVDEFQDTNELQLRVCLMLLRSPNLCAVGDWKQGIYGFRFVSIENITMFEDKVYRSLLFLNGGEKRVPFGMPDVTKKSLSMNFRSSDLVIGKYFEALKAKGTNEDEPPDDGNVTMLRSNDDSRFEGRTHFDMIQDEEDGSDAVVAKIIEYVSDPKYRIIADGGDRAVGFGDIAVLCRKNSTCRNIYELARAAKIPAFLNGEVETMRTREGKLALAWLRYVNNRNDVRGPIAILADMDVPLDRLSRIFLHDTSEDDRSGFDPESLPSEMKDFRAVLMRKRRRPNALLTEIFEFYGLDNDITQSIVDTLSSAYSESLMTVSDMIRLIEDDIARETKYDVDAPLDEHAVTIQTMHSSKGLEYPIVIVAGINEKTMPPSINDRGLFHFDDVLGLRCGRDYLRIGGNGRDFERTVKSWKWKILSGFREKAYDEERRLLFVSMSRAKQYLTLACGKRPSQFMKHFGLENIVPVEKAELDASIGAVQLSERPIIGEYAPRRINMGVHDLMTYIPDTSLREGGDESADGGLEYGTAVHTMAYLMLRGGRYSEMSESAAVRKVINSLSDAKLSGEVRCTLPVLNVSVRGIIDLMAEYGDRIEIHDWKTDGNRRNLQSYKLQLSIYAHAASGWTGKPARCFIQYVTAGETVEFDPLPLDIIEDAVRNALDARSADR